MGLRGGVTTADSISCRRADHYAWALACMQVSAFEVGSDKRSVVMVQRRPVGTATFLGRRTFIHRGLGCLRGLIIVGFHSYRFMNYNRFFFRCLVSQGDFSSLGDRFRDLTVSYFISIPVEKRKFLFKAAYTFLNQRVIQRGFKG